MDTVPYPMRLDDSYSPLLPQAQDDFFDDLAAVRMPQTLPEASAFKFQ